MSVGVDVPEVVVARYGELWLKGRNRIQFEQRLVRNVKKALEPIADVRVERDTGQLVIFPTERPREVAQRLQDVFGLSSISPARSTPPTTDAIVGAAREVFAEAMEERPLGAEVRVRVQTKRSDKSFPLISTELDRHVADRVLPEYGDRVRVDLTHPELVLGINVRTERAFVFARRLPGAGGLPVGTVGRAVCLLSGGIDSPVAAWMAMKRGCEVVFVSFHSYPYVGESFLQKVRSLVRALGRYQDRSRVYSVPFSEIQTRIRDECPEPYRTVLYRRMMQRIASRVASRERAGALVTGESLGQVASQTMENLACIEDASDLTVLRPLIAFDKQETIALAKRIGTYELSILPEPDCCTVFQPRRPIIRGRIEACRAAEEALDVEQLTRTAAENAELLTV